MLNRLQESDIKLLRVFYAVASCNGFTAAEPVLRMQRPNISSAIKKLEERLDLVLCHRGRGGFQMTKEGEVVFQETKKIFNAFDNFVFNLKSLHDDFSGSITLVLMSSLPTSIHAAVAAAVQNTMAKFSDIHVNIQTRLYSEVEQVAASGECHLILSTFDLLKPDTMVFHSMNRSITGRLYCAKRHPLAECAAEDLPSVNFERYPSIGISGLASGNYVVEHQRLSIQSFADSFEAAFAAVLSGQYVGLLPDYMVSEVAPNSGLVAIAGGQAFPFEHQLYVLNGRNTRLNPVLKFCISELKHALSSVSSLSSPS